MPTPRTEHSMPPPPPFFQPKFPIPFPPPTPQSLAGVTEATTPEITGESITQVGSTTTLVFTRPLVPADTAKDTLSAEEGEEATFIWAYGADNAFAEHAERGAVTVGDLFCGETTEDSEEATEDSDDGAEVMGSCVSSDPDFEFEVAPHEDLTFFWNVVDDGTAVSVMVRSRFAV